MTRNQMAEYTTAELTDYVMRKDEQYKKAPAFIRRTSFSNWNNTSAAICAEIQNRILNK